MKSLSIAKVSDGFSIVKQLQSPNGFNSRRKIVPVQNTGFTLIEILLYVFTLAIVSGVIVTFIFQTLGVNETFRRTREALDNSRNALNIIAQEIRHAESIYTPTSVFGTNQGQLSLETTRDLPDGENTTYVDFYVDNEGLFLKREGENAVLLTSEKVKVINLTFTSLRGSGDRETIRVSLTVEYDNANTGPKNQVTMTSTAVLRSY